MISNYRMLFCLRKEYLYFIKIYLLQKAIDQIVSTFYRQTLFGHFEYLAAKKAENGEPINHEVLSQIMVDLYKQYYGIDITEGILV